jgi:hypothetical protein
MEPLSDLEKSSRPGSLSHKRIHLLGVYVFGLGDAQQRSPQQELTFEDFLVLNDRGWAESGC